MIKFHRKVFFFIPRGDKNGSKMPLTLRDTRAEGSLLKKNHFRTIIVKYSCFNNKVPNYFSYEKYFKRR